MTVSSVKSRIDNLLLNQGGFVLCINGAWGVGKTHLWKNELEQFKGNREFENQRYAYVSLFGLDSLDDLRMSVFENTNFHFDQDLAGIDEAGFFKKRAEELGRFVSRYGKLIPLTEKYFSFNPRIFFQTITDQIVCIDDIERRGDKLSLKDLMGLVSYLKDEKNCRVAILLNEDSLNKEDQKQFNTFLEKVVDTKVDLDPTSEECSDIGLDVNGQNYQQIKDRCKCLNIRNIRIIKKIERLTNEALIAANCRREETKKQVIDSTILFSWILSDVANAPSVAYILKKRNKFTLGFQTKDPNNKEKKWNGLLDHYGFAHVDELDEKIFDSLRRGYFLEQDIQLEVSKLEASMAKGDSRSKYHAAWKTYHNSLTESEEEVLDRIESAAKDNIDIISPSDVNAVMVLLKDYDEHKRALDFMAFVFDSKRGEFEFFDLSDYSFRMDVTDVDLVDAMQKMTVELEEPDDPISALNRIKNKNGWSRKDIATLHGVSVNEFVEIFKRDNHEDLRALIQAALQFENIGNVNSDEREIAQNARAALEEVAKESRINAKKLRYYGIKLEDDEPKDTEGSEAKA